MTYANFWKRAVACILDSIIYGTIVGFINNMLGLRVASILGPSSENPDLMTSLQILGFFLVIQLIAWTAYYVWPESSVWQATIGKKILGLKVTDTDGERISFLRSLWRNFAKFFSSITLCIGYLMCLWTQKKQCLHDLMADCLVIDTKPQEKQGCLIGILMASFAFIILLFIGGIVAAIALPQFVRAGEQAKATYAVKTLAKVYQTQEIFKSQQGYYAKSWEELKEQTPICQGIADSVCKENPQFVFELKPHGVYAYRRNKKTKYQLMIPYESGKLQCKTSDNNIRGLCRRLTE